MVATREEEEKARGRQTSDGEGFGSTTLGDLASRSNGWHDLLLPCSHPVAAAGLLQPSTGAGGQERRTAAAAAAAATTARDKIKTKSRVEWMGGDWTHACECADSPPATRVSRSAGKLLPFLLGKHFDSERRGTWVPQEKEQRLRAAADGETGGREARGETMHASMLCCECCVVGSRDAGQMKPRGWAAKTALVVRPSAQRLPSCHSHAGLVTSSGSLSPSLSLPLFRRRKKCHQ